LTGIHRFVRQRGLCIAWFFVLPFVLASCSWYHTAKSTADYSRLLELIRLEDRYQPLVAFSDFEKKFDSECHRASLGYFNENPQMLEKIKADLGGPKLNWKLDSLEKRLVFVPEDRKDYAALYRNYCRDAIDFVLNQTKRDNPYADLITLQCEKPQIRQQDGIVVYLVHNLAKEYVETYSFFTETLKKKVKISLNGTVFIGEIGSYTSTLEIGDGGKVTFDHNTYTIWQDSAESPADALIVPIEETLHILLRPATERAIKDQINRDHIKTISEVKQIVARWIEVEEAVVGGLVYDFFPRIAARYLKNFELADLAAAVESRSHSQRYQHLKCGIQLVDEMGSASAMDLYMQNPYDFKTLLLSNHPV
jgi:hypothetical protein